MKESVIYRPVNIEFHCAHDGSLMPNSFGKFETPDEMSKFLGGNLTVVNTPLTVLRHLDAKEKKDLRDKCQDTMENLVPHFESKLRDAEANLADAKKELKDAEERYNATIADAKDLAREAKRGLGDMNLDEKYTFRIPYKGKYYFYTYIDKELKLCLIRDIPEHERQDLYNTASNNEAWIVKAYGDQEEKQTKK